MGRQYVPQEVPEWRAGLQAGRWNGVIEEIHDDELTSTGKYQIKTTIRTSEPMPGLPHFENFVIGTEADPEANDFAECMKGVAGQRYVSMLKKAGVEPTGDTDEEFATIVGQEIGFVIHQRIEGKLNRKGEENQYAGQVRSEINNFFHIGEQVPSLDATPVDGAGGVRDPAPARAIARAAAPAAAPRAAAPRGAASAAPAPRGAVGTPRQPVQPAPSAPRPAPARAVTSPPSARPAPGPAPVATARRAAQLKCQICNQMVNRDDFAAHVEAHEAEPAEE